MSNRTLFIILISLGIAGGLLFNPYNSNEFVSTQEEEHILIEETEVSKGEENVFVFEAEIERTLREPRVLNFSEVVKKIGYPKSAKEAGIEGQVLIKVLVDELGNYKFHKILSSDHTILTQAVEMHIDELQFSPAEQDGQKVQAWLSVPFVFSAQ